MAFDPVSFALGILATYAFSTALVAMLFFHFAMRRARKARKELDEALGDMMARVAVRCAERPTDSRVN